jgi:hypothetical protein
VHAERIAVFESLFNNLLPLRPGLDIFNVSCNFAELRVEISAVAFDQVLELLESANP